VLSHGKSCFTPQTKREAFARFRSRHFRATPAAARPALAPARRESRGTTWGTSTRVTTVPAEPAPSEQPPDTRARPSCSATHARSSPDSRRGDRRRLRPLWLPAALRLCCPQSPRTAGAWRPTPGALPPAAPHQQEGQAVPGCRRPRSPVVKLPHATLRHRRDSSPVTTTTIHHHKMHHLIYSCLKWAKITLRYKKSRCSLPSDGSSPTAHKYRRAPAVP